MYFSRAGHQNDALLEVQKQVLRDLHFAFPVSDEQIQDFCRNKNTNWISEKNISI